MKSASRLHLPQPSENLVYILAIALSPPLNYFLRHQVLGDLQTKVPAIWKPLAQHLDAIYLLLGAAFLVLFAFLLVRTHLHRSRDIRLGLRLLGFVASADLAFNLMSVNFAVYKVKLGSFTLLGEAFCLYLSLNMVFLFWYWYVDFPTQLRHLHNPQRAPEISFPQENDERPAEWLPHPLDYLFFTVLSSNTLGPPEGHSIVGRSTKLLQIVHTGVMLLVFLILIARAINTFPTN